MTNSSQLPVPNPPQLDQNLKMLAIKSIYFGGAAVYFADSLGEGPENPENNQDRDRVFLGFDCWGYVAKLSLHEEMVGLAVIPFGPMFGSKEIVDMLEPLAEGADIPLGTFLSEDIIESGALLGATITISSQLLVSGYAGWEGMPEVGSKSDLLIECSGEFAILNFTTDDEWCDGIVTLMRKDLVDSLKKYIRS